MSLKETIKAITDGTLPDDEQLALLRKLEASILTKKQEKVVEKQKDYVQAAIQTIVARLKQHEQSVKTQIKQIEDFVRVPGPAGIDGKNGKDGKNGLDGLNGRDGKDGQDGKDGEDGQDGKSIVDVYFAMDGNLVCVLSDGTEIDAGIPLGQKGGSGNTLISNWAGYSTEELKKVFIEHTFETVNKNLPSSDATLTYDANDDLVEVEYSSGVIKTLTYNAEGDLTTVVLSGDTPENIMLTKTLGYDGTGNLVSVTYS